MNPGGAVLSGLEPPQGTWRRVLPLIRVFLLFCFDVPMSAVDPSLHPLGRPIGPGEIHFQLRGAASAGESYAVESVYRPYREWDVRKTRHLGLLRGWLGPGSSGLIRTQREEFHSVRQQCQAQGSDMTFVVPLRDPDGDHAAYQLESVRVVGRVTGTLEFERWSASPPELDTGFGLKCEAASLRGILRPSGLGAAPLRGSFPLWPALRTVDVQFTRVEVPPLRLFEASAKHHWDGWRQTVPQEWPGGRTIVLRRLGAATVWREHEYHAVPPAGESPLPRPSPPPGVLPGVQLELFWPEGDSLEFPETRFDGEVAMIAVPVSKLPPRMTGLLAQSVRRRPGWEPGSLSAGEWSDLQAAVPSLEMPLSVEMASSGEGQNVLRITRKPGFIEPWVCTFGAPYDEGRRVIVTSLLVNPDRWTGPLPE